MSHGTIILFNISLFKLSELSPSWVLNVTEILESLITTTLTEQETRSKHSWLDASQETNPPT